MERQPWASGPGEILKHGLILLADDSDVNRRLALISIDNSVELMIKTYLGLPERVTGIKIARRELSELSQSFPSLLDGLERYATAKLTGVNLGEIEWYHRLRNELYHQGNGLTVERDKVEIYSELAKVLFKNLFGVDLLVKDNADDILSDFLKAWSRLLVLIPPHSFNSLVQEGLVDNAIGKRIEELFHIREDIIFGKQKHRSVLTSDMVHDIHKITESLESKQAEILHKLHGDMELTQQYAVARAKLAQLQAEQPRLHQLIVKINDRFGRLLEQVNVSCPVCGQSLSENHRITVLDELKAEEGELENRYLAVCRKRQFLQTKMILV
jgi:hypothetical protein